MQTTTEFVHSKSTRFIHGISAILILGLFGIGTAMQRARMLPTFQNNTFNFGTA
jgi:cytochrome b561